MVKNRDDSQLADEFELLPKGVQRKILLNMRLNPDPRDIKSIDPEVWATAFRSNTLNYDGMVNWFREAIDRGSAHGIEYCNRTQTMPRLATVLAAEHQEQYEHDAQFRSWIETLDGLLPLWVNGMAADAAEQAIREQERRVEQLRCRMVPPPVMKTTPPEPQC